MKRPLVIHPFLLAMFPILFLLENNKDLVVLSQVLLPSAVVLAFTAIAMFLLTAALRDVGRAGLVVSIFLVLFFSYGHVFDLIRDAAENQPQAGPGHTLLLAVWAVIFGFCAYSAVQTSEVKTWTRVLNVVAIALVAPSLIGVGISEVQARRTNRPLSPIVTEATETNPREQGDEPSPDIYYIILDRYASATTLEEQFHFDNSEFVDCLESKGFYVAQESCANYPRTFQSLASSLNMKHLTYLTDELGRDTSARTPVYQMLQDYEVWRFLKSRGYTFIHFGSSWEPTRENRYADVNFTLYPAEFSMMLYETTVLKPTAARLRIFEEREMQRRALLRKFDELAEVPDREGSKFVFAHFLLPHAPYLFGPQGEELTQEQVEARTEAENYLNQLVFTNGQVERLIDQILSKSERPPIIILQADEGPFIPFLDEFGGDGTDWRPLSDDALRTHMRILNAYYLPEADPQEILYPSVTPVNSFRVVFDQYFGTDYGLLDDDSYMVEDTLHPYTFINVTDRVKYD